MPGILGKDEAFKTTMRNSACASASRGFGSHLNHDIGLGLSAANQHAPRIREVEGFRHVLHLTLDELAAAGMADPCSTTKGRAKPMRLGEIEYALHGRVPLGGQP